MSQQFAQATAFNKWMTSDQKYRFLQELPVRSVAVFRPLKLGDFLVSVPALRAIRSAFPEARIDYIGLPWSRELLPRFHAYIDGFLEFPGWPGLPESDWQPESSVQFLKNMQRRKYDLLLQIHGRGRITNPLVSLWGARITAGLAGRDAYKPSEDWFAPYPEHKHEIERLLHLLQFLGLPASDTDLEFPTTKADEYELRQLGLSLDKPYVCLHPGAASSKPWPERNFIEVGRACAAQNLKVFVTGGENEALLAGTIAKQIDASAVSLAGKTSLGALAALIRGSAVFIGNDTGPAHLASALKVTSLTVFSTADPERWAPLGVKIHATLPYTASPRSAIKKLKELLAYEKQPA